MSILSRLFGGKAEPEAPKGVEYEGFRIFAEPMQEGKEFRLAARIEMDVDGVTNEHQLIRADTFNSRDAATDAAMAKAKQMIDQQGIRIFA